MIFVKQTPRSPEIPKLRNPVIPKYRNPEIPKPSKPPHITLLIT